METANMHLRTLPLLSACQRVETVKPGNLFSRISYYKCLLTTE